ncbi:MAG: histidine phosphatase family protein [Nitrospirales bacterium]
MTSRDPVLTLRRLEDVLGFTLPVFLVFLFVFASGCQSKDIPVDTKPVVRGNVLLQVYLVRHAESKKNVLHLPWTSEEELDTLTTKGREQAAAIANFLKDKNIVAIQSSPTGRTRETAQAMSEILGLAEGFEVLEDFASLHGGTGPDGNPVSWAWREQQWVLGNDPRPEGGESMSDGEIRARGALKKLAERFAGQAVAIVSHGDICAALLGFAQNTPIFNRYTAHQVPTGSVSEFIITDTGWFVIDVGRQPSE